MYIVLHWVLLKVVAFIRAEDIEKILELSLHDKKNKKGKVMFVLLQNIGEARCDVQVEKELILEAFEYYQKICD